MDFLKGIGIRSGEVKELMHFLWQAKLWFLIPFVIVLVLLGAIMIFAQSTGIAPFIYTII